MVTTSAWWEFVPFLVEQLDAIDWPPSGAGVVEVRFGPFLPGQTGELVTVRGDDGDAAQGVATMGTVNKNETGTVVVWVYVALPGLSAAETWCRTAELGCAVERRLRDEVTGKPRIGVEFAEASGKNMWDCELTGLASDVEPAVNQGGQVSGWLGWAKLSIQYKARI